MGLVIMLGYCEDRSFSPTLADGNFPMGKKLPYTSQSPLYPCRICSMLAHHRHSQNTHGPNDQKMDAFAWEERMWPSTLGRWCSAAVLCLDRQSCPTLFDPTDCSLPGSSVHGGSPGKNTGVGCHALLQEIFPTWGSNPGSLHCRKILYHMTTREAQEYCSAARIC